MAQSYDYGFRCPNCKEICDSKVIDSRFNMLGKKRRRECLLCGARFTTIETKNIFYPNTSVKKGADESANWEA